MKLLEYVSSPTGDVGASVGYGLLTGNTADARVQGQGAPCIRAS